MALAATAIITVPFITSAATFSSWLTVGSRGLEVTGLQAILYAQGYLKVSPTGYYGALTKQAVLSFQAANGLEPVGSVGPKTRALLNAYVTAHVSSTSNPPMMPAPAPVPTPSPAPVTITTTATTTASVSVSTTTSSPDPAPAPSPNDPPHVTLVSPAAVIPRTTTQTDMTVKTDKVASCRFGTLPGMNFSDMTSFNTSDGMTHTYSLSELSIGALYVYYVRCADMSDRSSQEMTVSFSITGQ
jgi:peptidoglycan hydrolase-like protein with peptidoglycan-binding domain